MFVSCPKCNSSLYDMKGGGIFTRCRKCGLNGDLGLELFCIKNEYELEELAKKESLGKESDF